MAKWDLTSKMSPLLDLHMVFPLLEFLSGKELYDSKDLLVSKLKLLSHTNMVDFAIEVHNQLYADDAHPDESSEDAVKRREEWQEKRAFVVSEILRLQKATQPVLSILSNPEVSRHIQSSRDSRQLLDYLMDKHDFKEEMIHLCFEFAKLQYECGNYSGAAEYLYYHRVVVQPSDPDYASGLWGKLASEILMQNWDDALEDLKRLQQVVDESANSGNALETLQQRTWFIHWSLFVFFNHAKGRELIVDLFLYQKQYLNAIQTTCPWVLRYLTTAVIIMGSGGSKQSLARNRNVVLKDLVKVIQEEAYTYADPITSFVEDLYVKFDFDGAQVKLRECETVLSNDFFLVACLDDFIENSRLMIFETFCRLHNCIRISMLASKLNMTTDEAERWIVNLIRNARLDAKIDAQLGHVIMGTQTVSPYQQLIEKTKSLAFKSQFLMNNVQKKMKALEQPDWEADNF